MSPTNSEIEVESRADWFDYLETPKLESKLRSIDTARAVACSPPQCQRPWIE